MGIFNFLVWNTRAETRHDDTYENNCTFNPTKFNTENHGGKLGSNSIAFRRSVNVFPCWCKQSVSSNSLTSLHLSAHLGKSSCVTVLCAEKGKQWVLEMSLLNMMLKYMQSRGNIDKKHEDDQNKLVMDVITCYLFLVVYFKQKFN